MSSGPDPAPSISPLSIGNIVSAGFRLYSSHFQSYFMIALAGTLWAILPYLAGAVIVGFFLAVQNYYPLLGLLIPALIVLFVYSLARYLANLALIARLAYGELTNQPEALRSARQYVLSRQWRFLLSALLVGLIFTGVILPIYIVMVILIVAIAGIFVSQAGGGGDAAAGIGMIVGLGLLFLVMLLVVFALLLWLGSRLVMYEIPLAVEPEMTVTGSIGRCWQLTKGNVWRIVAVILITGCITLPLGILAQVIATVVQGVVEAVFSSSDAAATVAILAALLSAVISFSLQVIVMPLWQTIKAAIYYDLRSRREGLGLQLRDRGT